MVYSNQRLMAVIGEALLNVSSAEAYLWVGVPRTQRYLDLPVSPCYNRPNISNLTTQLEPCKRLAEDIGEMLENAKLNLWSMYRAMDGISDDNAYLLGDYAAKIDELELTQLTLSTIHHIIGKIGQTRNILMHSMQREEIDVLIAMTNSGRYQFTKKELEYFGRKSKQLSRFAYNLFQQSFGFSNACVIHGCKSVRKLRRLYGNTVLNTHNQWRVKDHIARCLFDHSVHENGNCPIQLLLDQSEANLHQQHNSHCRIAIY